LISSDVIVKDVIRGIVERFCCSREVGVSVFIFGNRGLMGCQVSVGSRCWFALAIKEEIRAKKKEDHPKQGKDHIDQPFVRRVGINSGVSFLHTKSVAQLRRELCRELRRLVSRVSIASLQYWYAGILLIFPDTPMSSTLISNPVHWLDKVRDKVRDKVY
jgi:hypothetical protein